LQREAGATGSLINLGTSTFGAGVYAMKGHVASFGLIAVACVGAMSTTALGVAAGRRLPDKVMRVLFGTALIGFAPVVALARPQPPPRVGREEFCDVHNEERWGR